MFNVGRMKIATISLYKSFLSRCADEMEDNYWRYVSLMDFLGMPFESSKEKSFITKESAEGDKSDEERRKELEERKKSEESKIKSLVGIGRLGQEFSKRFIHEMEEYLPGGFFSKEQNRKIAENVYRMMYAQFQDILPKLIKTKLNELRGKLEGDIESIEGPIKFSDIDFGPETMNKVITDAFFDVIEDPNKIVDGLVRVYKRFGKKDEGDDIVGMPIARGLFKPRYSATTFPERVEEGIGSEGGGSSGVIRKKMDHEVIDRLNGEEYVKWRWLGIDEDGFIHFSLPALYGDREFTIKKPDDIRPIHSGEYTFRILRSDKNGVFVEFVEQKRAILRGDLLSIEGVGLTEEQLRQFIDNNIVNRYLSKLRAMPASKVIEEFTGKVITTPGVQELEEGEGEETVEDRAESDASKTRAIVDRWSRTPMLQAMHLQMDARDSSHISEAVSQQFPERSSKSKISLQSVLETQPVVRMVMDTIVFPRVVKKGERIKEESWRVTVVKKIQELALDNPIVRDQINFLIHKERVGTVPVVSGGRSEAVIPAYSDQDIIKYISKINPNNLKRLREEIKSKMLGLRGDPVLQKFFQRREQFEDYIDRFREDFVEKVIEVSQIADPDKKKEEAKKLHISVPPIPIDVNTKKGEKILHEQIQGFISRRVRQMSAPDIVRVAFMSPDIVGRLIHRARGMVMESTMKGSL